VEDFFGVTGRDSGQAIQGHSSKKKKHAGKQINPEQQRKQTTQ
jgi:hypothetical protein